MSARYGAVSIVDKHGNRRLRAFHVTTLETDARGCEHLGWALVPGLDLEDAARQVRRRWPELSILATSEVPA